MSRLTIRTIVLMAGAGLFAAMMLFFISAFDVNMKEMLLEREKEAILKEVDLSLAVMNSSLALLPDIVRDWSSWDETYAYVEGKNPAFTEEQLTDYPFKLYKLNMLMLLDRNDKLLYCKLYDFENEKEIVEPGELQPDKLAVSIASVARSVQEKYSFAVIEGLKSFDDLDKACVSGFVSSGNTWLYITAAPVLPSDEVGDSVGTFVFGRIIDREEIARLIGKASDAQVTVSSSRAREVAPFVDEMSRAGSVVKYSEDGLSVSAYKLIYSLQGDDFVLAVNDKRTLYGAGIAVIKRIVIALVIGSVVVIGLILLLFEKLLLRPLKRLAGEVKDIDIGEDSMEAHISDYRGYELTTLVNAIRGMLGRIATHQEIIEQQNVDLIRSAHHDALTGLTNMVRFRSDLNDAINKAAAREEFVGVVYIDIIGFKMINDTMGHAFGDGVLVEFGARLDRCASRNDGVAARFSGDEFGVLFTKAAERDDLVARINEILALTGKPVIVGKREIRIGISVGVSVYPSDGESTDDLCKAADLAMNHAKKINASAYKFYDKSFSAEIYERLRMEEALLLALERDEFQVYFQPKVDVRTNRIVGSEALVRWAGPEGMIRPDQFIPIADRSGIIVPITWVVLTKSCQMNKRFVDMGFEDFSVAVNIPPQVLLHSEFLYRVKNCLDATGLSPSLLNIELTESVLVDDLVAGGDIMRELQDYGVEISLDDFGTGYSSLQYLRKLPFNWMKIDKTFVDGLPDNRDDVAIVMASGAIARALNLRIVFEGVETLQQWNAITGLECDQIQGYVVSKPLPSDEFLAFVQQWNSIN